MSQVGFQRWVGSRPEGVGKRSRGKRPHRISHCSRLQGEMYWRRNWGVGDSLQRPQSRPVLHTEDTISQVVLKKYQCRKEYVAREVVIIWINLNE